MKPLDQTPWTNFSVQPFLQLFGQEIHISDHKLHAFSKSTSCHTEEEFADKTGRMQTQTKVANTQYSSCFP